MPEQSKMGQSVRQKEDSIRVATMMWFEDTGYRSPKQTFGVRMGFFRRGCLEGNYVIYLVAKEISEWLMVILV